MRSIRLALPFVLALAACGDDDTAPPPNDSAPADGPVDSANDAPPADAMNVDADTRVKLSDQRLYSDITSYTISPEVTEYEPSYALWADSADKRRWIYLPPGTQIDTTDMDHWAFPMGTQLYKEFSAPDGTLLETRLIEKTGPGTDVNMDWFFGAFIWNLDGTEAYLDQTGEQNVLGTEHDVPSETRCKTCHKGEPGMILGFSAIQLSHDGSIPGPNLTTLAAAGTLTAPPPPGVTYPPPDDGTGVARAALGYMHANCGLCHNEFGNAHADVPTQVLRLFVSESAGAVDQTQLYLSTVDFVNMGGQAFEYWAPPLGSPVTFRIASGDHLASGIWFRMSQRDNGDQMPPFFTEYVDDTALTAVADWIDSL